MIGELWKSLVGYLQQQPYWNRLQPILLLLLFYVGTTVTAYQYVQWQYGLAPAPPEFVGSYLFKQITVAYLTFAGILLVLLFTRVVAAEAPPSERWRDWLARSWPRLLRSIIAVAFIVVVAAFAWVQLSPSRFAPAVRIKFDPPGRSLRQLSFDPIAFTYLIYELNRRQRAWHFEVDLEPFAQDLLAGRDVERCKEAAPFDLLCAAVAYETALKGTAPLILITEQHFAAPSTRYYYWLHEKRVSVISASDWDRYAEPSVYDYLVYSTIIQTILIHLDTSCTAPEIAHQEGRATQGDIFEFQPNPDLMRVTILSAHLGRQVGQRLFNCFGPAYTADAGQLLALEWLHNDRVRGNLQKILAGPRR